MYTTDYWKFLCSHYFGANIGTIYLDGTNEKWKWLYPKWKIEVSGAALKEMPIELFKQAHKLKFKLLQPPEKLI